MERARLEELSLEELQEEATSFGLTLSDRRDIMIDVIMTHFERHGPQMDFLRREDTLREQRAPRENLTEGGRRVKQLAKQQINRHHSLILR